MRSPSIASSVRGSSGLDVLVERVDEHPERQVALELGRAAREHDVAALVRAGGELGQQPRLADPRLADQLERSRTPALELARALIERFELGGAADERLGKRGMGLSASITQGAREFRVQDQGGLPMSGRAIESNLVACPASSSTTATSRVSAASCSPPSGATRARCATSATLASCAFGGHAIWWSVEAAGEAEALGLLPFFVAERATATRVDDVDIP